jgi:hypothetical protein
MKKLCIVGLLAVLSASRALRADAAAKDFPQTVEGKVLARYLGQWHGDFSLTLPKERLQSRDSIVQWALEGRWLLVSETGSDGFQFMDLATYDPLHNAFVAFIFASNGTMLAATGKWDESARQMTWTYSSEKGIAVITNHFVSDALIESSERVTDASGKIIHEMTEKRSRKSDHGDGSPARDAEPPPKQEASSEFQESSEAKVLARYTGQWRSVLVFMGWEKQIAYDATWVLRGRWLRAKINLGPPGRQRRCDRCGPFRG